MGGKSKSQTVGYKYFASIAIAIGNRIEDLLGINFDKRGWQVGTRTDLGLKGIDCYINKPSLYGENEGGVRGNIRIHLGQDNQEADEWYQRYFPLVSAYPNQSYLVFGAPVDVNTSINIGSGLLQSIFDNLNYTQNGFYVGNSGFLKEMMLWPKRIHVKNDGSAQWYDAKSEIPAYLLEETQKTVTQILQGQNRILTGTSISGGQLYQNSQIGVSTRIGLGSSQEISFTPYVNIEFVPRDVSGMAFVEIEFYEEYCEFEFSTSNEIVYQDFSVYQPGINKKTYVLKTENFYPICTLSLIKQNDGNITAGKENNLSYNVKVYDSYSYKSQGAADINPIHKIREILTDDTAMGKPESDINDDNFIDAANRIYSERLGVSWAITEKSCKEALDELCDHIEAGVRVNRQTGKYEVILFRDDWYNLSTAQSFNESNIKTLQLDVANSDEIINTLNVTYYDRANIKKSAFNVAEIGLIHTVGHEQAETVDFPYFMNRRNAEIVANWKLKQLSTPAWSGAFTTGSYEARKLNRYDVVKLSWASKGLVNLPVRITKISLGDGRDNTVTIDFVEVVPYSAMTTTTINVDPPITQPGIEPQPNQSVVFEMPYLEAVQNFGQYDVDNRLAANPDISYLMVATKRPQDNSLNCLLYTDSGTGYEKVSGNDYCATADLDQAIGYLDSSFAVKNTIALDQVAAGSVVLIDDEIMVFQSYDAITKIMTVKRGALDTVPQPHAQNAVFYFYDNFAAFDATQYVQGEVINAKVLTTTPSGVQDIAAATALQLTMQARAIRPYPPANVKINAEYYPVRTGSSGNLVLTWVDRNRVQQTGGAILGFFDAGVTIESGVTYQLIVYAIDMSNVETAFFNQNIGAVNTYTLDISMPLATAAKFRVVLKSIRGGYENLQSFDHVLLADFSAPYNLTAEYIV